MKKVRGYKGNDWLIDERDWCHDRFDLLDRSSDYDNRKSSTPKKSKKDTKFSIKRLKRVK
jgi:hypothetical protein